MRIKICTYTATDESGGWLGWVEPEDGSWIVFLGTDGEAVFFGKRDPSGAVVT